MNRMHTILDSQGDEASVELHKNCYCSFTSKCHVQKLMQKKRDGSNDSDEPPVARIRRSQVIKIWVKKQGLFCADVCLSVDLKHPDR